MIILLLLAFTLICFAVNVATRALLERIRQRRLKQEREEVLSVSLKLDVSMEARSLKRVEVADPVARILCVDDEEIILDSFRKILVLDGYSVDTVQTGQEALGLIQTRHYDFVFTDLRMPSMEGTEVVKSVKHLRPDIDVIIITGYATVETAVDCMKQGAMDYVEKPFTEDELRSFVKKALIKRQDQIEKRLKPTVHITSWEDPGRNPGREFSIPGGVFVSAGHCWASLAPDGMVRIGLDDFARKLIGRVDAVEPPALDSRVRAGQALFTVLQGGRRIVFHAPVGGRISELNAAYVSAGSTLAPSPYHHQWICIIASDNLAAELPDLRIGKSAVAFFQEDLSRFIAFMQDTAKTTVSTTHADHTLCIGAMETFSDEQWNQASRAFFDRSG